MYYSGKIKLLMVTIIFMETAINQAITAHKEGKFEEAELLYRQILKTQKAHPDANHNLGVIVARMNKPDTAISLFKIAVLSAPHIEQFWISYISVLISEKRFKEAELVCSKAIKLNSNFAGVYRNSGLIFFQLNKFEEAEVSFKKAIKLNPDFPDTYNNLGIIFYQLRKLEEAEINFKKAIELKPNYAEAHNNLGSTLLERNKTKDAEINFKKAIELKPNYAEAHNNLGVTLKEVKKFEEAEKSYKKAIALKVDYAEAHNNLGITLYHLGKLEEAETICKKAISLKDDYTEAYFNLSMIQDFLDNLNEMIIQLEKLIEIDEENYSLKARVNLAIIRFLNDDFISSKKLLLESSRIHKKIDSDFKIHQSFHDYLTKILNLHENTSFMEKNKDSKKKIYVIGESHSLVSHRLSIKSIRGEFLCKSILIMGCKQWHIGNDDRNRFKKKFDKIFDNIPKSSEILLSIGEIDCRIDNGIIKYKNKNQKINLIDLIEATTDNYLNYVCKINSTYKHNITIQGIPCPNIKPKNISREKVNELIDLIKQFNISLKKKSIKIGFNFLDLYELTDRGDGSSNKVWHLDSYHLNHKAMQKAWSKHFLNNK